MLNIELKDTIVPMCSTNYKDRFVAEYIQLKIRYEMLKAFNTRIKAAVLSFGEECEAPMPKHDCPDELLREQQKLMGELLHVLEVRAVIEGIDLAGCMKMLSDKAREREEERKDMIPLSECTSDAQIVTEAIARCMHLDVTCDEEDDLLFGAAVNVISKLRELEEPCVGVATEAVDLKNIPGFEIEMPEGKIQPASSEAGEPGTSSNVGFPEANKMSFGGSERGEGLEEEPEQEEMEL